LAPYRELVLVGDPAAGLKSTGREL
jgi:hypothetical protein